MYAKSAPKSKFDHVNAIVNLHLIIADANLLLHMCIFAPSVLLKQEAQGPHRSPESF
jgi:hypothetical protein